MQIETFSHDLAAGWSLPALPALDSPRTLVLAFGAAELMDRPEPLAELRDAYPRSCIVGCSTAGEITGALVSNGGLSVAAARFDHTTLQVASARIRHAEQSYAVGKRLASQLNRDDLRSVFVLSDGLNVNGGELVNGLNSVLPADVVVTGGLAADGDRFQRTWVLRDGAPQSHVITAVGLYGDRLRVGHSPRDDGPLLSVAIHCVGRRLVLGESAEEGTEAALESLPAGTQQVGFCSYGEISPHTIGSCAVHDRTMTLTTWREL